MLKVEGVSLAGNVSALATVGRGHSADELADMALRKLIHVSDDMPDVIRQQAVAYRERMRSVLVHYLRQAKLSERTTIINICEREGYAMIAESIRRGQI